MKKAAIPIVIALLAIFIPFLAYAGSAVPNIEKDWQYINLADWYVDSPEYGRYSLGVSALYRAPERDKHGIVFFSVPPAGNNEAVLTVWWQGGEKPADNSKEEFAIKDDKGNWLSGLSRENIRLDAEIDGDGNIFALYFVLNVPAGGYPAGTEIRKILFNPPLNPVK